MTAVGKYRVSRPERGENGVCVLVGIQTLEIRESTYIDNGYEPPLETLPWDPPQSHASVTESREPFEKFAAQSDGKAGQED